MLNETFLFMQFQFSFTQLMILNISKQIVKQKLCDIVEGTL